MCRYQCPRLGEVAAQRRVRVDRRVSRLDGPVLTTLGLTLSRQENVRLLSCWFAAVYTSCHLSLWERSRREPRERVFSGSIELGFELVQVTLSRPLPRPTSPRGRGDWV